VTARYRRSPHVLCYWTDVGAVIYNYATAVQAQATDLTWQLLDCCNEWRTAPEVRLAVAQRLPASVVIELLEALVSATFCEASDRSRVISDERMDAWKTWNPSAGFFHTVSRQCQWGDQAEFANRLKAKARSSPMPHSVKPPRTERLTLPSLRRPTRVSRLILDRRTWRQFGRRPMQRTELATLLRLTSGITHWLTVPGLGEVPLKTSPSGGARHPIETYVVVLRVRDVPAGVYRYAADRHELDVIRMGATENVVLKLVPMQPWSAQASIVIFFTAVFERTRWKYDFARAYRAVLIEAGHVCQTFLLTATSLGLAPFSTMAVDDAGVEALLGLDGVSEAVLYAAGAGTRPRGGGRAIMPAGDPPAKTRVHDLRDARALGPNAEELLR
jgi:SagB-type dehydrogenase family enzyme